MSNIYGGRTWEGTSFVFDIIYNNKKEMTDAIDGKDDGVYPLRYVLVKYCDTAFSQDEKNVIENSGGSDLSGDSQKYWDNYIEDAGNSQDRKVFRKIYNGSTPAYEEIAILTGVSAEGIEQIQESLSNLNIENGSGIFSLQSKGYENRQPIASGVGAVALGDYRTEASGNSAMALGAYAVAQGTCSFATGNSTLASGPYTFAAGLSTEAANFATIAMGHRTRSLAHASSAFGYHTVANQNYETVVGVCNDKNTPYALFVVGNGDANGADHNTNDDKLSNAFVVYKDGHATLQTAGNTGDSVINKNAMETYVTDVLAKALNDKIQIFQGDIVPEGATAEIVILYQ